MNKENPNQGGLAFPEDRDDEFLSQRKLENQEENKIDDYLTYLESKGWSHKRIEETEEILNNRHNSYNFALKKTNTTERQIEKASDGGYSGRGDTCEFYKFWERIERVIEAFETHQG